MKFHRRPLSSRPNTLFVWFALLACATSFGCSKPVPTVEDGMRVSLLYQAKTIEGELVDANPDSGPIVFLVGAGKLQPKVEAKLLGMKVGEEKTVSVQDAYGLYDDSKTGSITLDALPEDAKVGDEFPMVDGMISRIKEIRGSTAVLDLNHHLAGKEIIFTVKVVDVSDPNSGEAG